MTIHGTESFERLPDASLLAEVQRLTAVERHPTVRLIGALGELDARRLYLGQGCSSLFTYCTQVLHLSEHAAYGRIEAARLARKFPVVLDRLVDGSLTLTTIGLLAPHLTAENLNELLDAARHKSKREVEHIVARLRPQPDVASRVRKLPASKTQAPPVVPEASAAVEAPSPERLVPQSARPAVIPLAPERYKVQFTVSRETYEKLRRAQDLLRHTIPNGDPAAIFDRALTVLLEDVSRTKLAATERPGPGRSPVPGSRHIPSSVKREVWKRDGGRCAFVGTSGRCAETAFLEFHHVVPYADGGEGTVRNIELRCRAHNVYEAEQHFGTLFVREARPIFWSIQLGPDLVRRSAVLAACSLSSHKTRELAG